MWPIHKKEAKSTQTNLKITQILELEVKDSFIFFLLWLIYRSPLIKEKRYRTYEKIANLSQENWNYEKKNKVEILD